MRPSRRPFLQTHKVVFGSLDYQRLLAIRREVFVQEQNVPEELEVDEFEQTATYFLTTLNGEAVATGRLRVKGHWIKFERIATLKRFRGQGLGAHLMKEMLNYAQIHYPELTPYMHSQAEAVPFYLKLGWRPEGEPFTEANISHLAMKYPREN